MRRKTFRPSCIAHLQWLAFQVENDDSNGPSLWALLKGAPEIVQPFLKDAPPDYEQSYKRFASEGARSVGFVVLISGLYRH